MLRVEAPHFVAGVVIRKGVVAKAAPILGWTVGKKLYELNHWCERKGYMTQYLPVKES